MTDSLRALLSNLIDYAGLYPPAGLPLEDVLARYRAYRASADGWMLNRLVLPAARLRETSLEAGWRVTLLVDADPGPLPPQVETLEIGPGKDCPCELPVYREAPVEQIAGEFAKIRTGGLTSEAIPSARQLASFLHAAAARRLAFKATAGLHHAIRAERALTYAEDAPRAVMHGFLNVFVAAAFAWMQTPERMLLEILGERDAAAFEFYRDELLWRGHGIGTSQIAAARREFAHSFGSCSFEEPVADLRELGLLS